MSKTVKIPSVDLENTIMAKVKSNEISMKPKWYFIVGSFLAVAGLVGLSIGAIFLTNLTLFLLRRHGPMGEWRFQQILVSFPLWVPVVAILSIGLGIWMLKKFDFSYRKNFWFIILGFIFSVVLAAFVIERLGLNDVWSRQGPMKRFYQQVGGQNQVTPRGQGREQGRGRIYQQSR